MLGRARMKGRRRTWAVLMFLTLVLGLWCFWIEPASLRVKAVDLSVAWPYRRPLRLAVVSDLHVGAPYHGLSRLRSTVDRINATNPDLVAILGDFVTLGVLGGRFTPPEPIAAELRRLSAPLGVFGVLGNHDRLVGGARVRRALVGAGIRVLEDTAVSVDTPEGPIWIAGVSDYWTAPHDVARALHEVDGGGLPILLLTHNPDIFPTVPSRVMLTLAGHTHGGQVRLPLIGAPMVPSAYGQRYAAGHVVEGGRQLFVSTGIGTSDLPIRFNVPPTIFLLTLYGAGLSHGHERSLQQVYDPVVTSPTGSTRTIYRVSKKSPRHTTVEPPVGEYILLPGRTSCVSAVRNRMVRQPAAPSGK